MPVVGVTQRKGLTTFSGAKKRGGPRGIRGSWFWDTRGYGIPRREDLVGIRLLESTHTVRIPMEAILGQVATTPFVVRSTKDKPTSKDQELAADAEDWFRHRVNSNLETSATLFTAWIHDLLSIDSGILELVPYEDGTGQLAEMYVRDGMTFTKNVDTHGRLPRPGSQEPAYWQFSFNRFGGGGLQRESALFELLQENWMLGESYRWNDPIPFTRDAIVWLQQFSRPNDVYGLGRVQKIQRLVEIILNQDVTNLRYFTANEIPEGILNFLEAHETEVVRTREWWQEEIAGREHKIAIVGGPKAEWIPFRPALVDLQFLQSQEWYNKLVWYTMGVPPSEIGAVEDVNRANGLEQSSVFFRKTIMPILELVQLAINRQVLPFLPEYAEADGELEWVWETQHPALEEIKRRRHHEDMERGVIVVNEVRKERGMDPLPWGDMPQLMRSLARGNPRWALESWLELPEDELPPEPSFGLGLLSSGPTSQKGLTSKSTEEERPRQLSARVRALQRDIAKMLDELGEDLEGLLDEDPAGQAEARSAPATRKGIALDVGRIVDNIQISEKLREIVTIAALDAMAEGARYHARRAEDEVNATLDPGEPEIAFAFDVQDTLAARRLRDEAAKKMRHVEDTIKEAVRRTLVGVLEDERGSISMAKEALRGKFRDLSLHHAENIARTEVLSAARYGAQALAESTDLIAGKQWVATGGKQGDGRTRAWHAAMHGQVVDKDQAFLVPRVSDAGQPADYPREAFVVGDDQPYNCRCDQRPVLARDMPRDAKSLLRVRGVVLRRPPAPVLSKRQREVLDAHGEPGEDLYEMIARVEKEAGSRNRAAAKLGVSKATLYGWLDERDS